MLSFGAEIWAQKKRKHSKCVDAAIEWIHARPRLCESPGFFWIIKLLHPAGPNLVHSWSVQRSFIVSDFCVFLLSDLFDSRKDSMSCCGSRHSPTLPPSLLTINGLCAAHAEQWLNWWLFLPIMHQSRFHCIARPAPMDAILQDIVFFSFKIENPLIKFETEFRQFQKILPAMLIPFNEVLSVDTLSATPKKIQITKI